MNEIKQELDILFIASYYQPTSNNTNGNRISNNNNEDNDNNNNAPSKPGKYLSRHSFLECVVRLSKLIYPKLNLQSAIERFIQNELKNVHSHFKQREDFRTEYVYKYYMNSFFHKHGQTFQEIFERQSSVMKQSKKKSKPTLKFAHIYELYKQCSILNVHFGIRELRNLYRQSIAETKKIYKHGLNYSEFLDLICRTAKVYNHPIMVSTHHVSCDKVRIGLLENKVTQRSWMESMEKFVMKIEQGISIWR